MLSDLNSLLPWSLTIFYVESVPHPQKIDGKQKRTWHFCMFLSFHTEIPMKIWHSEIQDILRMWEFLTHPWNNTNSSLLVMNWAYTQMAKSHSYKHEGWSAEHTQSFGFLGLSLFSRENKPRTVSKPHVSSRSRTVTSRCTRAACLNSMISFSSILPLQIEDRRVVYIKLHNSHNIYLYIYMNSA